MFTGNRITNPVKPVVNTALTSTHAEYMPILEKQPELVKVIERWADLPEDMDLEGLNLTQVLGNNYSG